MLTEYSVINYIDAYRIIGHFTFSAHNNPFKIAFPYINNPIINILYNNNAISPLCSLFISSSNSYYIYCIDNIISWNYRIFLYYCIISMYTSRYKHTTLCARRKQPITNSFLLLWNSISRCYFFFSAPSKSI